MDTNAHSSKNNHHEDVGIYANEIFSFILPKKQVSLQTLTKKLSSKNGTATYRLPNITFENP